MRMTLVLLAAGVGLVLFTLLRRPERIEEGPGGAGVIPAAGRTWDLANWSEGATTIVPPPGLPPSTRRPTARSAGIPGVKAAADAYGVPGFPEALAALAMNESGGRLGMPAWTYDNRPQAKRPPGKSRISAWGIFQWQDAHAKKNFGVSHAYQMTPDQEIAGGVARYAQILAQMDNDPAGIFLWHITPAGFRRAKELKAGGLPPRAAVFQAAEERGKGKTLRGYLLKWDALYGAAGIA